MQFSRWSRMVVSAVGILERNASRVTKHRKLSGSIFLFSILRQTSSLVSRSENWRPQRRMAVLKTKDGGYAKMVHDFGQMSSSLRFVMMQGIWSVLAR